MPIKVSVGLSPADNCLEFLLQGLALLQQLGTLPELGLGFLQGVKMRVFIQLKWELRSFFKDSAFFKVFLLLPTSRMFFSRPSMAVWRTGPHGWPCPFQGPSLHQNLFQGSPHPPACSWRCSKALAPALANLCRCPFHNLPTVTFVKVLVAPKHDALAALSFKASHGILTPHWDCQGQGQQWSTRW